MEKTIRIATYFLLALTAFYPAATALTAVFGYKITLCYIPVFAMLLAVLSVGTVIAHLVCKQKKMFALTAVLALVSIVNTLLLIFACNTPTVIISTLFSAICCCVLPAVHAERLAVRVTALVLSVLMLVPVCYCGFIFLIFGNIGQNTVVQSAVSPDGRLCAEVINSDQGALGGNTLVQVRETYSFDAQLFVIEKKRNAFTWANGENSKIWKLNGKTTIVFPSTDMNTQYNKKEKISPPRVQKTCGGVFLFNLLYFPCTEHNEVKKKTSAGVDSLKISCYNKSEQGRPIDG